MKEGTYSEAHRAGFTSDQCGFLARMGSDVRHEAVREMQGKLKKEREQRKEYVFKVGMYSGIAGCILFLGVIIGKNFV